MPLLQKVQKRHLFLPQNPIQKTLMLGHAKVIGPLKEIKSLEVLYANFYVAGVSYLVAWIILELFIPKKAYKL